MGVKLSGGLETAVATYKAAKADLAALEDRHATQRERAGSVKLQISAAADLVRRAGEAKEHALREFAAGAIAAEDLALARKAEADARQGKLDLEELSEACAKTIAAHPAELTKAKTRVHAASMDAWQRINGHVLAHEAPAGFRAWALRVLVAQRAAFGCVDLAAVMKQALENHGVEFRPQLPLPGEDDIRRQIEEEFLG